MYTNMLTQNMVRDSFSYDIYIYVYIYVYLYIYVYANMHAQNVVRDLFPWEGYIIHENEWVMSQIRMSHVPLGRVLLYEVMT